MSYARKNTADTVPCYDKALDLLARRAHSVAELTRKLAERGYSEEQIDSTIARLEDYGFLNDQAYATHLAEKLRDSRGFAPRRIAQELRQRGVQRDETEETLSALSEDFDAGEAIRALLAGKFARHLDSEQGRRRAAAALQRMGYGYSDIRAAFRAIEQMEDEENG
ncbi:MAG: recombination regulator RecX [Oscillospiraceae bacterium]|jgi:regulatory protein|nr:recombination regulator RecX [Oscillospiraceae bacterium]